MDDFGIYEFIGCILFTALLYCIAYLRSVRGKSKLQQQYHVYQTRQSIVDWLVIFIKGIWIIVIAFASLVPIIVIFGTSIQNNFMMFLVFAVPIFCIIAFWAIRKVKI